VHQLRIGLRRLRSALQLFRGVIDASALQAPAASLFRRLGAVRDRAALQDGVAGELRRAMGAAGVAPLEFAHAAALDDAPEWDAVRDASSQEFMLLLLAAMHDSSAPPLAAKALRRQLQRRLDRWHLRLQADARRHAELDELARHALRKRVKRQRYAGEFCAGLFEARAARRYLRALRGLQDRLGACTDATLAIGRLSREPVPPAPGWFALGWLIARRDHLIDAAEPALRAFVDAERFW
jgi:CHAD domain-containing protein